MFKFLKRHWAIFLVFALCFWAVKALFVPGFFTIHDDEQIARLFELESALADGQFPVRWVSHLGFGFGYPLFNFYPPFAYWLGEIFHTIGFSFINSMKAVVFTGFLCSAFFMYLWTKNHFGKLAGLLSALFYTYASYHAIDIYVRGDIPEFFSFVWIPAVFWCTDLLFKTQKLKYVIILSVLLALVVLTHSLIAFPFLFFFVLYVAFLLFINREKVKENFFLSFSSAAISSLISIFFWLPVFLEKKFTLVDQILTTELANYKIHFVYLRQLWDSPWGYGGSIFGLYDGLSFEVGKLQLVLSLLGFLIIIFISLKRKRLEERFKLPLFISILLLISLFMTSFYSQWIWEIIPLLSFMQFPWRFLLFTVVFSSFLSGFFIGYIEKKLDSQKTAILVLVLGLSLIVSSAQRFQPEKYLNVSDSFYTNYEDISWRVSKMSFEFVPKGVATKLSDIGTTQLDIENKDIPSSIYKVLNGDPRIKIVENKSHFKKIEVDSKTESQLIFNTFSFPGWKAAIDGKNVEYKDNNKLKLIVLDIPKGKHVITLNFANTLPRAVGNAISLVAILNLIGFGLLRIRRTP